MKSFLIAILIETILCLSSVHIHAQAAQAAGFLTAREQANQIDYAAVGASKRVNGLKYEQQVQIQFENAGYKVETTIDPNNMGVDRIAKGHGKIYFIQAKAWQNAREGAKSGLLDALEFYGGAPDKRIPYLQDAGNWKRQFIVSIPKYQYDKLKRNGAILENGLPSQGLIGSTITEKEQLALESGKKAARYRNVAGHEQEILGKVRFVPGPVNAIAGEMIGSGFGLILIYTSGSALLHDLQSPPADFAGWMSLGEHATLTASGGAMTAASLANVGSLFATTDNTLSVLNSVSKWGGRASLAGILITEPFAIGLDYKNWNNMTTGQKTVSVAGHGANIGAGTYQAYRIYRASRAVQILAGGAELALVEEAVGAEASGAEFVTVVGAPAAILTEGFTQVIVIVTLAGTCLVAGGQAAYDYFHPPQPSWNSSAYSELSPNQKRQVEDSVYQHYGVTR